MYAGRFECDLFNGPEDGADALLSIRLVSHYCTMLYRTNVEFLLSPQGKSIPNLMDSGVYYKIPESDCGGDVWQHNSILFKRDPATGLYVRGYGDCKDLACALAAEITVRQNIVAVPYVRRRWFIDGFALYHVIVALPDGRYLDPSLDLGMDAALAA